MAKNVKVGDKLIRKVEEQGDYHYPFKNQVVTCTARVTTLARGIEQHLGDIRVNSSSEVYDERYFDIAIDTDPFCATETEQELLLAIRAGKIAMPVMPKPKQQVTKTFNAWVFPDQHLRAGSILGGVYPNSVPCKVTVEFEV